MKFISYKNWIFEEISSEMQHEKNEFKYDENVDYPRIDYTDTEQQIYNEIIENEDLTEFLGLLVHSKGHVMSNTKKVPEFDKIFNLTHNAVYNGNLYRGMYTTKSDIYEIGKEYSFDRYESFSENLGAAKFYSEETIMVLTNPNGNFNYGGYMEFINDTYGDYEGDEILTMVRYEREHIINMGLKYKVINIETKGAFTYIEIILI